MKRLFSMLLAIALLLSSASFANAKELGLDDLDIFWWEDVSDVELVDLGSCGHFLVKKDVTVKYEGVYEEVEKFGVVSKYGKVIIPIEYDLVLPFKDDKYYLKKDDKVGLADSKGNIIMDFKYDDMPFVVTNIFFSLFSLDINDILGGELTVVSLGEKMGLIDDDGKEVYPPIYDVSLPLNKEVVLLEKDDKTFLYDTKGNMIKEVDYEDFAPFSDSYIKVVKDGKYGIIDNAGNVVIEFKYDDISDIEMHGIANATYGEKVDYINKNAEIVKRPNEPEVKYGLKAVEKDGKYALATAEGKVLTEYKYDRIFIEEDYIKVRIGPDYTDGEKMIADFLGETSLDIDGLELRFGLLNREGEEITEIKYKEIDDYWPHGLAVATVSDVGGLLDYNLYINKKGEEVISAEYFDAFQFDAFGLAMVSRGLNSGFINTKGEEVIPLKYYIAEQFQGGLARVMTHDRKWGWIDRKGDMIIAPIFDDGTWFGGNDDNLAPDEAIVKYGNKIGLLKHPMPELIAEEVRVNKEFDKKMGIVDDSESEDVAEEADEKDQSGEGKYLDPRGFQYEKTAEFSPLDMTLDGETLSGVQVYLIDGHNYFKLRDIAMLAKDSKSKFSVAWDGDEKLISATRGEAYEPVGTELKITDKDAKKALLSTRMMQIDGEMVELKANTYNIAGENYFQIRVLAEALGFGVDWNEETKTVEIKMN